MAPIIPTYRPLFTATRMAAAVAVVSVISSLVLLAHSPADAVSTGTAVACAAHIGGLR